MPVSHRFSRRAAAIGAALALAALPISATFTPAFAQPSPTPTAEASASAEAGASAGADSSAGDDGGSTADGTDGADADSSGADNGITEVDADDNSDPDPGPDEEGDKACKDQEWTSDEPCAIEGELEATWDKDTKQLSVKPNDNKPGSLPKSWEGVEFDAPTDRGMVRVPAQDASIKGTADSTSSDSDTDDSGRSVAEATTQADAPTRFEFGSDGTIRAAGEDEAFKFAGFGDKGPDPEWTFKADGKNITASGEQYSDDEGTAEASSDSDGTEKDGTADSGPSPTADGSTSSDGAEADGGEKTAGDDGVTSDDGSANDREATKDGSSADSEASADSTTSTDGGSSSDSGSKDRANTSGNKDSDSRDSDADTGSGSDGSRSSDSDGSGSDSGSGKDDEKDSDGAGSSAGTSDADGTTPDPSNGNGSPDDERETIPGTAGDEFLPGDDEGAERPDYSDPVPRNPDEQTPKDDTDLITGGDQPSPRANQNPATSFGESIISTIVSSWPIFVLAASGMAAVGFIIYLMGRRGKQD